MSLTIPTTVSKVHKHVSKNSPLSKYVNLVQERIKYLDINDVSKPEIPVENPAAGHQI
jgi:hypothetical protein